MKGRQTDNMLTKMYILGMKVVQTFGLEWIQGLNTVRRHHAKGIFSDSGPH